MTLHTQHSWKMKLPDFMLTYKISQWVLSSITGIGPDTNDLQKCFNGTQAYQNNISNKNRLNTELLTQTSM